MSALSPQHHEWANLLKDIREEVIGFLFNRYVFRTVQEIIRLNEDLHSVSSTFSKWTQAIYGTANGVGVRRVAGSYEKDDINFVRLLDMMLPYASELVSAFERHCPNDLAESRNKLLDKSLDNESHKIEACKRLIGIDRKILLGTAQKVNDWASKRGAHHNPKIKINTTFNDLDKAVDTVRILTEKYILLVYDQKHNLLQEMKVRKLSKGWDKLFLKEWATSAMLALPLGETLPPEK